MRQKFFALIAFLLLLPAGAAAASLKVTLPKGNETYELGDTIKIKWTPKAEGVESIEIVSARADGPSVGIYGPKVFGDPVNYSGKFSYELPNYLIVPAGKYRVRLNPADGGRYVESRTFNLWSAEDAAVGKTVKAKYRVGTVSGLAKTYAPGEAISFSVRGYEIEKTLATPEHSFNVQAHLYESADLLSAVEVVNASYDYTAGAWNVGLTAPQDEGKYVVKISLYCGYVGADSYCAQKYDSYQAEKKVKFKVAD